MSVRRIGILTAGGDCPGLNAVIRAVVKSAARRKPSIEVVGILDGYAGLVEGRTRALDDNDVSGLLPRGGTILGTSNRDNPFKYIGKQNSKPQDRSKDLLKTIERDRLDALIAVGGDGTLSGALAISRLGVPVIGVPKTIDNDLNGTNVTFGYDTAVTIATEAIDRLHTTAESHHRVLICEVMGRNAGWIALRSGMAGGGDVIVIPEIPYSIPHICEALQDRIRRGKNFSILVVAEGAKPVGGTIVSQGAADRRSADPRPRLGGISQVIARDVEDLSDSDARVVILGHLQRGGTPTAFDRWLATCFGIHAVNLAEKGLWNHMTALQGNHIGEIPIAEAVGKPRRVDPQGESVQAARMVGTSFGD